MSAVKAIKDVRPTSSRVLLALFNILGAQGDLTGCNFLDLFAGTGHVGFTALARGAARVVWVESVRARANAIESEIARTQGSSRDDSINGESENLVLALELRRAVSWLLKREQIFDIIFADPPYSAGWGGELLGITGLSDLLAPDGTLVVEHSVREKLILPTEPENLLGSPQWVLTDQRDYGETRLSFLKLATRASIREKILS